MNKVTVCGETCKIDETSLTYSSLECKLPMVKTTYILDQDVNINN